MKSTKIKNLLSHNFIHSKVQYNQTIFIMFSNYTKIFTNSLIIYYLWIIMNIRRIVGIRNNSKNNYNILHLTLHNFLNYSSIQLINFLTIHLFQMLIFTNNLRIIHTDSLVDFHTNSHLIEWKSDFYIWLTQMEFFICANFQWIWRKQQLNKLYLIIKLWKYNRIYNKN